MAEDEPENIFTLSAEGETHAQLARALADGIGEQAIDAGDGDEERDETEDAEQTRGEGLRAEGGVDDLLHGGLIRKGEVGVQLMHGVANGAKGDFRGETRADHDIDVEGVENR